MYQRLPTSFVLALSLAALGCTAAEPARPRALAANAPAPTLEAQTLELARASLPGAEHRRLSVLCGHWNVTMVAVDLRGEETELATGGGELEWVLDGRFLRWSATLSIAGAPRSTTGFLGFDLRRREYELLMISNLATGMSVATGLGDPQRTGLRFTLEAVDPTTGVRARAVSVLRLVSPDHFVLDQVAVDAEGRERVVQRHHYRRRAAAPPAAAGAATDATTSTRTRGD